MGSLQETRVHYGDSYDDIIRSVCVCPRCKNVAIKSVMTFPLLAPLQKKYNNKNTKKREKLADFWASAAQTGREKDNKETEKRKDWEEEEENFN